MLSHMEDLDDFMDMETMQFVNPYDVNPIVNSTISSESSTIPSQVSLNPDHIITQKDDVLQNQLKMEEFSDISALLTGAISNVDLTGCTDELNTPVFDKEAFDFTPPPSAKLDENNPDLKVKVEYNTQYYSKGKQLYPDLFLNSQMETTNVSAVGNEPNDMYLYQPFAHSKTINKEHLIEDYGEDFLDEMLVLNESSFANNLNVNVNSVKKSNSTSTSPQDDRYSYISSPADELQADPSVPEPFDHTYETPPKLNLMLEHFKFPIKEEGISTLNTPDVIDEVVQMGSDFNILKLVNNEDIDTINADNDFLSTLTSPHTSSETSTPSTTEIETPAKRPRKRKLSEDYYDEDDADYVPPSYSRKQKTIKLADIDVADNSSSDGSYYQEPSKSKKLKASKPRGRPPKRNDSVSSDGSRDLGVSRYRELRDKNNEASRKSRLKRKVNEQKYEKEADELYTKNIRLTAQVEELEKMVSTFRTNLFKILVTK